MKHGGLIGLGLAGKRSAMQGISAAAQLQRARENETIQNQINEQQQRGAMMGQGAGVGLILAGGNPLGAVAGAAAGYLLSSIF